MTIGNDPIYANKISMLADQVGDLCTTALEDAAGLIEGIERDLREVARDVAALEANFEEEE